MIELYEALLDKFNTIVTTYEGTADKGASLPYAVMSIPSSNVDEAGYREDVTVQLNIFDDKKNSIRSIEGFCKDIRTMDKTKIQTENGSIWINVASILPLDFDIQDNRRREITFNVKWYDGELQED